LHRIDDAQGRGKAENFQILYVGQMVRLEGWFIQQELDINRLPARQHALAVHQSDSRLLEELCGPAQPAPVLTRSIGDGRHIRVTENFIGDLIAKWLEQRELGGAWLAGCLHR